MENTVPHDGSTGSYEGTFRGILQPLVPDLELAIRETTDETLRLLGLVPEFERMDEMQELIDEYRACLDCSVPNEVHEQLKMAILDQAIVLLPDGHKLKPDFAIMLARIHNIRYEARGELEDLNKVIEHESQAASITPDGSANKPAYLNSLGSSYTCRFEKLAELADIDKAIECYSRAVSLTPDAITQEHAAKPGYLTNLGISHAYRFERLGELVDVDRAIEYQSQAASLTPDGHASKPGHLTNLGNSHTRRFQRLGELADIDTAIECHIRAVSLTLDGHADQLARLNNLGGSHMYRFERLGEIADIDKAIECQSQAVSLAPDGHTNKPGYLNNLGTSYMCQFKQLGELADIDRAIEYQSRAVSLSLDGHADKPAYLNNLGGSHMCRFERLGELTDIERAIECQSRAILFTPDGHTDKPARLSSLGGSHMRRFERLGQLADIGKAIEYQSRAVSLAPDGQADKPEYLSNLGTSHECRFERLGEIADIDKAIEYQSRAVSLAPDEHANKPGYLNNLGSSHARRFKRLGEIKDIDKAIKCHSRAVSLTPDGSADKLARLNNLGGSYMCRFERLSEITDIDRAIECQSRAVSLTPDGHANKLARLNNLGSSHICRFERLGELMDIDRAIECQSQAVSLTPDGHAEMPRYLNNLGGSHSRRFKRLGKLSDIDTAIGCQSRAVSLTPDGHAEKPARLINLGNSHQRRFNQTRERKALIFSLEFYRLAAQSSAGHPSTRLNASRRWAVLSFQHRLPESLEAYKCAMDLLPQTVWLGMTVARRYEVLETTKSLGSEAAAAAIQLEEYELALEWLEEGRSIVWSQMLQLRTPFDSLSAANPALAERLRQLSQDLDQMGSSKTSASLSGPSLEQAARLHRRLASDWDKSLGEVRLLPDFHDFLKAKKVAVLAQAAHSHAVVTVNVHKRRCDALAIVPGYPSALHIPLPSFSYNKAAELKLQLLGLLQRAGVRARTDRRPEFFPNSAELKIDGVLAALWTGVAKPVLEALALLQSLPIAELPHLTWCTTGPLAFLPLHAAGCYDEPDSRIFNYVTSSYTPTLSALLDSPHAPIDFRGILAVGYAAAGSNAALPGTVIELSQIQEQTGHLAFTRLDERSATPAAVLDAMEQHSWVHLACHASQRADDPLKSAFHLQGGDLSLATITQKPLKGAEFAFLSACETATGNEKLPDEAIHLAAGMIMAGYRGVIATMWSIRDEDAPLIAKEVYARLLEGGVPDSQKAAYALHDAVGSLRAKVGEREFARWVPYIHFGH